MKGRGPPPLQAGRTKVARKGCSLPLEIPTSGLLCLHQDWRQKGKASDKGGLGDVKVGGKREREDGDNLLESGVYSWVEFYDFECLIPLQFGAGQVLLQLQQHRFLQTGLIGDNEMGDIHFW